MTKKPLLIASVTAVVALSGCATDLTGVGGSAEHQCPMPTGGACQSLVDNYHDSTRETSPGRGKNSDDSQERVRVVVTAPGFGESLNGFPLMTTPRVLRVYITPWRDSDDNLMDGRKVYTRIDEGRWRIDHFDASVNNQAGSQPSIKPPPEAQQTSAQPAAAAVAAAALAGRSGNPQFWDSDSNDFIAPVMPHGFSPLNEGAEQ